MKTSLKIALGFFVVTMALASDSSLNQVPTDLRTAHPRLPDGSTRAIWSEDDPLAPLDPERWAALLTSIEETGVGEAFWVVVQDEAIAEDLLLRFERIETGLHLSDAAWAPRGDENFDDPRGAYYQSTGEAVPRKGSREVIVQSFRRRVVNEYRYTPVPMEQREGLLALLEPDEILREAHRIPDSSPPLTVALVFQNAVFVPSDCETLDDTHDDQAEATLVLVEGSQVLERFSITEFNPVLTHWPRIACQPQDRVGGDRVPQLQQRQRLPLLGWLTEGEPTHPIFLLSGKDRSWFVRIEQDPAPLITLIER